MGGPLIAALVAGIVLAVRGNAEKRISSKYPRRYTISPRLSDSVRLVEASVRGHRTAPVEVTYTVTAYWTPKLFYTGSDLHAAEKHLGKPLLERRSGSGDANDGRRRDNPAHHSCWSLYCA